MNTDKIYAESIANAYSVKEDSKVVALRKLDQKVRGLPLAIAIALGTIATLILGTGLCFAMGAIGGDTKGAMIVGIILGLIGMVGMVVNYPLYQRILANRKRQYAGDILRLASQISNEA